jgi:2-C-methyl-D-erythritol 2,4-cyclodiphosphate synthase
MTDLRVGSGFDMHSLSEGRRLVLGGVTVPFDKGLVSNSDGDVLTHAVIDALFGAAALGNIGSHFPPSDTRYRAIPSLNLLKIAGEVLAENGWKIVNLDTTVVAEKPRLTPYLVQMGQKLAQTLGIKPEQVSVKAKTSDGMGIIGHSEAIAAIATALIESSRHE